MNGCIKECPHGMVMQCLDCEEARFRSEAASAMHRPPEEGAPRATASAVAAAKAQIVGWLRFQEREWRDTSANLGSSVAGNVAAHYAQALHNAIESIESDAPERWAAEREDERG